jgi:phospholipid/cholesterol/gamma-HCH transport system permease protein
VGLAGIGWIRIGGEAALTVNSTMAAMDYSPARKISWRRRSRPTWPETGRLSAHPELEVRRSLFCAVVANFLQRGWPNVVDSAGRKAFMIGLFFARVGRWFLGFLTDLGKLVELLREVVVSLWAGQFRWRLFFYQIVTIGFGSQLVVIVTGAFTGAVFGFQVYSKFNDLGLESAVGAMVSIAMCRELAPVLTALMVAGRVGAAMAGEIGTMQVTEQVDALRAFGVHPVDYLVTPRVFGMAASIPLLIAEAITFGIVASYLVTVQFFDVPGSYYQKHMLEFTHLHDIIIGMIKGFVFGLIIVVISCQQGLTSSGGAVGVGRGTTQAVVLSSLSILIINFFLSILLNLIWPLSSS